MSREILNNGRFFLTVAGPYKKSKKRRDFRSGYEMDRLVNDSLHPLTLDFLLLGLQGWTEQRHASKLKELGHGLRILSRLHVVQIFQARRL